MLGFFILFLISVKSLVYLAFKFLLAEIIKIIKNKNKIVKIFNFGFLKTKKIIIKYEKNILITIERSPVKNIANEIIENKIRGKINLPLE